MQRHEKQYGDQYKPCFHNMLLITINAKIYKYMSSVQFY